MVRVPLMPIRYLMTHCYVPVDAGDAPRITFGWAPVCSAAVRLGALLVHLPSC